MRAVAAAFRCAACGLPSVGLASYVEYADYSAKEQIDDATNINWLPVKAIGRDFEEVPEHIATAATEATECLSIGHYRAAVLLARAVVEATAKDKEIRNGNLRTKIDEMHARHLIRPDTRDAAHEIRFLGNEMAHGDFATAVASEEAEDTIELMSEVLNEIYQGPARTRRRQASRLARKGAANEAGGSPVSAAPA